LSYPGPYNVSMREKKATKKVPKRKRQRRIKKEAKTNPYIIGVCNILNNITLEDLPDLTVKQICDRLDVSGPHLARVFRDICGFTPHTLVKEVKMKYAKHMLIEGKPIKEISYLLGFGSVSGFSRTFKKCYKFAPATYLRYLPFLRWLTYYTDAPCPPIT